MGCYLGAIGAILLILAAAFWSSCIGASICFGVVGILFLIGIFVHD